MKPDKTGALTQSFIFERASLWSFRCGHVRQSGGARGSEQSGFMGWWQDGQSGGGKAVGGIGGGGVQSSSARMRSQWVLPAGLSQPK